MTLQRFIIVLYTFELIRWNSHLNGGAKVETKTLEYTMSIYNVFATRQFAAMKKSPNETVHVGCVDIRSHGMIFKFNCYT